MEKVTAMTLDDVRRGEEFLTRNLCPHTMIHYLAQMPSIDVADRLAQIATPTLVLTQTALMNSSSSKNS